MPTASALLFLISEKLELAAGREGGVGGVLHSCAVFTFDMLETTSNGVMSPTTVTFFAAKSILNDFTPAHGLTH